MAAKKVKSSVKKKRPAKKPVKKKPKELSDKHRRKLARMGQGIDDGGIKTFAGLIDILDKTPLGNAMGYQGKQFEVKLNNPLKFNMGDVLKLAELTGANKEKTALLFLYYAMGLDNGKVGQPHKNNPINNP